MKLTDSISINKPAPLLPNGTIGITAPSSQINIKAVTNFAKKVESEGYNVVLGEVITYLYDSDYNAGSPEKRAEDFNRMVADPNIDAIWCAAGGFGAQTITPYIDFDAIKKNPKPIIGFSDNTFFLNAITGQTGIITFLGPTAEITNGDVDIACIEYALDLFAGAKKAPYKLENFDGTIIRRVSKSDTLSSGKIVGGNITMVQTSLGTPFEIDTKGKVILLEEVGESSYSIERALEHLRSAGKFDDPAAVVIGEFSNIKREPVERPSDGNPSIHETLLKYFRNAPYPVIMGYNFSHGRYNLTIPIGAMAKVSGETRSLEILDDVVKEAF